MSTGATIRERYSVSIPRTGSARLSRIALTGWGADGALAAFTDNGRLWVRYTHTGTLVEMFRRPSMASADLVCSGTVSSGVVALSEANSSGITGTADIEATADSTLDIVLSYASEYDLRTVQQQIAQLLDDNNKWQGEGVRFERLLVDAKRYIDNWIIKEHFSKLKRDSWGRWALGHVVNTYDLARSHALVAVHIATLARAGIQPERHDQAMNFLDLAKSDFNGVSLEFDNERDLSPDDRTRAGVVRIERS